MKPCIETHNRMALSLKKKTAPAKATKKEEKKEETTTVAAPILDPKAAAPEMVLALVAYPRVSEKAAMLASTTGTYVFNVPINTNKLEVRKAVEKQFKVNVTRVNMVRGEGKIVRRGRIPGKRSNWKKALVTLKKGQTIELHKGV